MNIVKCRFVEPIDKKWFVHWICKGEDGHYHRAEQELPENTPHDFAKYRAIPVTCDECGQAFPSNDVGFSTKTVWSSGTTKLEPGDMYWVKYLHNDDGKCLHPGWEDCDPRGHLHVILPNGNAWDIDSRASNCTMKDDRTHRCWVRHGEPPDIHVDKNGHTCAAGAGSILSGDYHGFLHNGELVSC